MKDILEVIEVLKQKNIQKTDKEKNDKLRWLLTLIITNDDTLHSVLENINE